MTSACHEYWIGFHKYQIGWSLAICGTVQQNETWKRSWKCQVKGPTVRKIKYQHGLCLGKCCRFYVCICSHYSNSMSPLSHASCMYVCIHVPLYSYGQEFMSFVENHCKALWSWITAHCWEMKQHSTDLAEHMKSSWIGNGQEQKNQISCQVVQILLNSCQSKRWSPENAEQQWVICKISRI